MGVIIVRFTNSEFEGYYSDPSTAVAHHKPAECSKNRTQLWRYSIYTMS